MATQNRLGKSLRLASTYFVLSVFAGACGGPASAPEEELRQWVNAGQAAAEAKKRRALINMISPAYADARGSDRDAVEAKLRAYFFRQKSVTLLTTIEAIRVIGGTAAEVDMTVAMTGTNDSVLGFSASAYRFELELEKDDDEWLLISSRYAQLGEETQ
jgi:hypothetical protein